MEGVGVLRGDAIGVKSVHVQPYGIFTYRRQISALAFEKEEKRKEKMYYGNS